VSEETGPFMSDDVFVGVDWSLESLPGSLRLGLGVWISSSSSSSSTQYGHVETCKYSEAMCFWEMRYLALAARRSETR
jgi:hypothetical protein